MSSDGELEEFFEAIDSASLEAYEKVLEVSSTSSNGSGDSGGYFNTKSKEKRLIKKDDNTRYPWEKSEYWVDVDQDVTAAKFGQLRIIKGPHEKDWFCNRHINSVIPILKVEIPDEVIKNIQEKFETESAIYAEVIVGPTGSLFESEMETWSQVSSGIRSNSGKSKVVDINTCIMLEILAPIYQKIVKHVTAAAPPFLALFLGDSNGCYLAGLDIVLATRFAQIKLKHVNVTLNPHWEGREPHLAVLNDSIVIENRKNFLYLLNAAQDVTLESTRKAICSSVKQFFRVADSSGVNFVFASLEMETPTKQMEPNNRILTQVLVELAEALVALQCLAYKGTFIVKVSNAIRVTSLGITCILSKFFEELYVIKPTCTKQCSPEAFIVCIGFVGRDASWKELETYASNEMMKRMKADGTVGERTIFLYSFLPQNLKTRLRELVSDIGTRTLNFMKRNASCYVYRYSLCVFLKDYQRKATTKWQEELNNFIPTKTLKQRMPLTIFWNPNSVESTTSLLYLISSETNALHMSLVKRLKETYREKMFGGFVQSSDFQTCNLITILRPNEYKFNDVLELPVTHVLTSRFVNNHLLYDRALIRKIGRKNFRLGLSQPVPQCNRNPCVCHSTNKIMAMLIKQENQSVDRWRLKVLCFLQTSKQFFQYSDLHMVRNYIREILNILPDMREGDSLFICRFPLYTRLLVGIACSLAGLFDKSYICCSPEDLILGLAFVKFNSCENVLWNRLINKLDKTLRFIESENVKSCDMQLLDLLITMNCVPLPTVENYNEFHLRQDLKRHLTSVEAAIKKNNHINPL